MKVLRFALMACLIFGLTACSGKSTEKGSQKQGAKDEGDYKQGARNDDKGDGDKGDGDKAPKKEQLVGTWEVKTEDVPPGTTMEFTDDGKMKMSMTGLDKKVHTMESTYELDGDTIKTSRKEGGKEVKESHKIISLTDKELVTKDEKGMKDTMTRKK
ncbi:MAG TPA: hypothetical protein VG013_25575 [Gemmataceae bacterium]|nr:hypothetical protein [Gemmataceae bacterium]